MFSEDKTGLYKSLQSGTEGALEKVVVLSLIIYTLSLALPFLVGIIVFLNLSGGKK